MTILTIPYEKYIELYRLISDDKLGTEVGDFERTYKCTMYRVQYNQMHLPDQVDLHFPLEEDAFLFSLKWL